MKKETIYIFLVFVFFILVTGCNEKKTVVTDNNEVGESMKIFIDDIEYVFNIEDNETTKSLIDMLPLELDMTELNENEKYVYLDKSLPTNSYNPKHINSGDVMLYGDNCLVIFYRTFNTTYSYTKIGHIDDLPILQNDIIKVRIEK